MSQVQNEVSQVEILEFYVVSGVYKAYFAFESQQHVSAVVRQNSAHYVSVGSAVKGDRKRIALTDAQITAFKEFVKMEN